MSANKVSPKTVLIIAVAAIVFIIAMLYVISNQRRSRAALGPDGASVTFTPSSGTLANGTPQVIKVRVSPVTATNKFQGFDIFLKATGPVKLVSIGNNAAFKDPLIYSVTDTEAEYARVLHVNSGDPSDTIATETEQSFIEFDLTVQGTGNGQATIQFDATRSEVSGTLPNNKLDFDIETTTATYQVGSGGGATNTPVPGASNTPVPQASNTPIPSASNTPVPQPSNTPGGTGNASLNMKLKFQGIPKKPTNSSAETVQIKLRAEGSNTPTTATGTFTPDDAGVYNGTVSMNVTPGSNYTLYVKGPRHLQKKICVNNPVETATGTYRCGRGQVTISAGTNSLDLTKVLLLVGDLPAQDGIVDAYDTSFIRQSFGSTDIGKLAVGDLNRDGIIDTQDMSLVIQSLNVKYDDE